MLRFMCYKVKRNGKPKRNCMVNVFKYAIILDFNEEENICINIANMFRDKKFFTLDFIQ